MQQIRPPAVAGRFYPATAEALGAEIDGYLAGAVTGAPPKALIVPHAGYRYSGAIAAHAYATLVRARTLIDRVVLLGPAHRVALRGAATSAATAFATPLGEIPLDQVAIARVLAFDGVRTLEEAHAEEHSLEVQLPFLQRTLDDFSLIPLVVGETPTADLVTLLETLWGGEETLIVVSSDLSHYHRRAEAQALDRATSMAIERLDVEAITPDHACGCYPLRGLLALARRHGLSAHTLALSNSGAVPGTPQQVVGYGAYAFH
ncbi:AmmeMemoRadiSam system protein B [Marichromatium bheemlicum]|uniref:MEMO1 family protein HF203_11170 n=1 Tax=Marichromatium bheemlicum TaxID=365339 RepID=A0ABX1I9Q7_9GAMM|nr:AmmeMemoRadiSam system protein B [Marichromatium bheemlicum]NKN33779.1 AmmeMemoRadiSam system protein B [Marichromatium bheemlicum]